MKHYSKVGTEQVGSEVGSADIGFSSILFLG